MVVVVLRGVSQVNGFLFFNIPFNRRLDTIAVVRHGLTGVYAVVITKRRFSDMLINEDMDNDTAKNNALVSAATWAPKEILRKS